MTIAARIFPPLVSLVLLAALAESLSGQTVRCDAEPRQIFVGQKAIYQILVRGSGEAELVTAPACPGLTITKTQEGPINQSRGVIIINGQRRERSNVDYAFLFEVSAEKPGQYTIPDPVLSVNGKTLRGTPVSILVEGASAQDLAFVEMTADNERIVRGEQVTLTVSVLLKHLTAPAPNPDPLSFNDRGTLFERGVPAPAITLPWLPNAPLGLAGFDLRKWAGNVVNKTTGFRMDPRQVDSRLVDARLRIAGEIDDVERRDAAGSLAKYRRYRFAIVLRGETVGTYDLPAAALEGQLAAKLGNEFRWREIFVRSQPLTIRVEEPPVEGKPASFRGAIGSFRFTGSPPIPATVSVGEPVYLTYVVEGQGYLKGVDLDLAAMLGPTFRVDPPKVLDSLEPGEEKPAGFPDRPGTWRQFEFKVRPLSTEVNAIPEIEFSFFDSRRRTYETLRLDPVTIIVRAGPESGSSGVMVATGESGNSRSEDLVATSALAANVDDLNNLRNQLPNPWLPVGLLAALLPAYVSIAFFVKRRRALIADPLLLRRKMALARAMDRIRDARAQLNGAPAEAQKIALQALLGYAADREGMAEEALTNAEFLHLVERREEDAPEWIAPLKGLCDAVEASAFGGAVVSNAEAAQRIDAGEKFLASRKRQRTPAAAGLLLAGVLFSLGSMALSQDAQGFQTAQSAFLAGRHDEAALEFRKLLHDGYENGYVLYNLGNAELRAGRLGASIAAYRRAALYLPGDANLEMNLGKALERRQQQFSLKSERAVLDYVLFWRGKLTCQAEAWIALACAALAFALALLRLYLGRKAQGVKWIILVAALVSLLFLASAVLDYLALKDRDHGAITANGTLLLRWPASDAEKSYEQPVDDGAEFRVLDRRDGWLKVLVADRFEGWVRESSAATW